MAKEKLRDRKEQRGRVIKSTQHEKKEGRKY